MTGSRLKVNTESDYLGEIYAAMATELDPTEDSFTTDSRFLVLEEVLRSIPSGQICDLGCGRGALIKRLRDYHSVFGCDFDAGAVEACLSGGLSVRRVDLNSAKEIPFPEKFDAIILSEVCEHLLAPRNALRLAREALLPTGLLIVTIPNAVPLFVRMTLPFGRTIPWLHYPSPDTERTGHIRFYTVSSMSHLLSEQGFLVSDVRGVSFRMNGYFWARLCYWLPKLLKMTDRKVPTRIDAWLGRHMPTLSPGFLFVCQIPNGTSHHSSGGTSSSSFSE